MIKNKFKFDVGFSDHTIGTTAAIVSVSLGATVIEKHFTTSKIVCWDHSISANPSEMRNCGKFKKNYDSFRLTYERKISLLGVKAI